MQGKILDYNTEFKSGLIRGEDGNKYRFSIDDCKSTIAPKVGAEVDFEPNGDKAVEIYVVTKDTVEAIKNIASSAVDAATTTVKSSKGTIKKIIFVAIAIFVVFAGIAAFVGYLQEQREQQRITDLINQCNSNNAKACYEYSMELKYYSGERTTKIRNEVLAKGCQLGSKDACREGEYYKEGCALQDGESCYKLAQNTGALSSGIMCANDPGSYWCERAKNEEKDIKEYYQKACQYGYSQGCLQK